MAQDEVSIHLGYDFRAAKLMISFTPSEYKEVYRTANPRATDAINPSSALYLSRPDSLKKLRPSQTGSFIEFDSYSAAKDWLEEVKLGELRQGDVDVHIRSTYLRSELPSDGPRPAEVDVQNRRPKASKDRSRVLDTTKVVNRLRSRRIEGSSRGKASKGKGT